MPNADQALIDQQIRYYRQRAPEYDEWYYRRGRYDHGPEHTRLWQQEIAAVRETLDMTTLTAVRVNRRLSPPVQAGVHGRDAPEVGPAGRARYRAPRWPDRQRAPEYDEWYYRRGRYDHGPEHTRLWQQEIAAVRESPSSRSTG